MSYLQNPGMVRAMYCSEYNEQRRRVPGRPHAEAAWSAWYHVRLQAGDMVANAVAAGKKPSPADLALWRACAARMTTLHARFES